MAVRQSSAVVGAPSIDTEPHLVVGRIALVGNPNTGKTTLFNRLCGTRAKTSNFPGTTTSARIGRTTIPGGRSVEVVDLPGLYDLSLDVPEARVCRSVLRGEGLYRSPDAVVVVVDACNLTRNLVLVAELIAFGRPVIVALNMLDIAQRRGLSLDAGKLAHAIGCQVVPTVARRGVGIDGLRHALAKGLGASPPHAASSVPRPAADSPVEALTEWADRVVAESVGGAQAVGEGTDTLTERLDQTFTHPVLGVIVFMLIMGGLFWVLFALAAIPMKLIETTFAALGVLVGRWLPPGPVHDLLAEGIIAGVAGTIVFLPQICLLFFLISLLEDTGYLARAAFVMDRLLCRFGLPGHAFVPLLTAHACALPGHHGGETHSGSPRSIGHDPRGADDELLGAASRLRPVDQPALRQPPARRRSRICRLLRPRGGSGAPERAPLRPLAPPRPGPADDDGAALVQDAVAHQRPAGGEGSGTRFSQDRGHGDHGDLHRHVVAERVPESGHAAGSQGHSRRGGCRRDSAGTESAALLERADRIEAKATQSGSFAGRIGHTLQPVFAPLGFDWQLTVGVLTSFLAREVFVSTMSVLVGGSGDPDVNDGVIDRIRQATRDDGSPLLTAATSASLLVFFALAMQCLPTLAVTRRETGSIKWAAVQLGYMSSLAYVVALLTYQGLGMLGIR